MTRSKKIEPMDQQKPTKTNKNLRKAYEALKPNYKLAVELKLRGYSYLDIAQDEQIKASYSTIREWFMTGGRLHQIYEWRKQEWSKEVKERFIDVDESIQSLAPDAVETYRDAIKNKKSWMAAESLLDRAGFKPSEKYELVAPTEVNIHLNVRKPEQN
jgi:hypothetical protein